MVGLPEQNLPQTLPIRRVLGETAGVSWLLAVNQREGDGGVLVVCYLPTKQMPTIVLISLQ